MWFKIIIKIISDIESHPSPMYVSLTTKEVVLIDLNSWCKHEITKFWFRYFSNKQLILRWRKCSPLCLKIFHSSWSNGWRLSEGPRLIVKSPEKDSSNQQYELEWQNLSCKTDRKIDCECKWEVYIRAQIYWSIIKNCNRLQTLMSWWGAGR